MLRVDFNRDRWVGCDWSGNGIGDSVAIIRHLTGWSFVQAVRHLLGLGAANPLIPAFEKSGRGGNDDRPKLPARSDPRLGREYLASRGILDSIRTAAEDSGAVYHLADGIAFVGRDVSGVPRAVTIRHFVPKSDGTGGQLTKRDLKGSDKAFPVILSGELDRVIVVEGAVTALAVQSLATLAGRTIPTVIATGGVNTLRWLTEKESPASSVLLQTQEVIVSGENETSADGAIDLAKQTRTDMARKKLIDALSSTSGTRSRLVYPPVGCKDAAEWLVKIRRVRRI